MGTMSIYQIVYGDNVYKLHILNTLNRNLKKNLDLRQERKKQLNLNKS